jgi:flagellar motor switch protein FliN/FliY
MRIELGRARLAPAAARTLAAGQVVSLEGAAGSTVDMVVGGRVVARGELLTLHHQYCVRVTELLVDRNLAGHDTPASATHERAATCHG